MYFFFSDRNVMVTFDDQFSAIFDLEINFVSHPLIKNIHALQEVDYYHAVLRFTYLTYIKYKLVFIVGAC